MYLTSNEIALHCWVRLSVFIHSFIIFIIIYERVEILSISSFYISVYLFIFFFVQIRKLFKSNGFNLFQTKHWSFEYTWKKLWKKKRKNVIFRHRSFSYLNTHTHTPFPQSKFVHVSLCLSFDSFSRTKFVKSNVYLCLFSTCKSFQRVFDKIVQG